MIFGKHFLFLCCIFITGSLRAQVTDSTFPVKTPSIDTNPTQYLPDTSSKPDAASVGAPAAKKTLAQKGYRINGKVEDGNTGEGIPFATVFFPHTQVGTAADLDGNFVITADRLPSDTLHIEALGYKPVNKILRKETHDYNYILELERSAQALNEVVVHAGEDPAVVLMRHIIERKPFNNPDRVESYRYEAHNRLEADLQRMTKEQFAKIPILKSYTFVFDNLDTQSESKPYLPLYLTETISDFYFRSHPKKQREFIKASIVKGVDNEHVDKYLGTLYQNVNVYRNYIPVFDKKFVSPVSNEGLFFYKYKIIDTQRAYGHNIILVQYRPRRSGENCFVGDFWVVDSLYAIQRISMDVPRLANINWIEKASLYQEFAPVDSVWFCVKDKFVANFSAYKSQKFPGMIGRKTTTYHHIHINDSSIANVIDNPEFREDITRLDSARLRSDEWWQQNRLDTLTKNEKAIYSMVDTINKMPITRVYKNTIIFLASGVKDIGPIQLGPYYYIYSRNPVEGNRFRFSFGTPRSIKNAHLTAYVAYGTRDGKFKYGGTGLWLLDREPRMYLYGSYTHDINANLNNPDQQSNDNIFSTIFRKPGIPWKQAFSDGERLEFYKQYPSRFSHKLIVEHNSFSPYNPLPDAGVFTDTKGAPSLAAVSTEIGVELRFAYKEKYLDAQYLRVNLGTKYPVINLELTAGIKNVLNSGYAYQKARFSITERINVPPFGTLYYNVFAGKYFGTLPYPLLEIHPGNEYYYYNKYAFEMMNTYEFLSDRYAGFNVEHNFGGGIFNKIPVLKMLKFRQFWTAKGVIGELSDANKLLNLEKGYPFRTLKGDPYLELGTGVSNILQVFRIDFVWRVTPVPISGESKARYFGIFWGAQIEF